MRRYLAVAGLLLVTAYGSGDERKGVPIVPDADGVFEYVDDFATARFLEDAFLDNTEAEVWQPGSLVNAGPHRNRTVTYRLHGRVEITSVAVSVAQRANARHLVGTNALYISVNGLDWVLVSASGSQPADAAGWQTEPLRLDLERGDAFTGRTDVWVRLVLDNGSGVKTNTSSMIHGLRVSLTTGDVPGLEDDPQAELRGAWDELLRAGGRLITLSVEDPQEDRAPHYFEDADGWLRPAGEVAHLRTHHDAGLPIQRAYHGDHRSPLSLAAFVETLASAELLLARVRVRADRGSSRSLAIRWNGETAADFDVADYFPEERVIFARLEPVDVGVHELRLEPQDQGRVLVREIAVAGPGAPRWADKPALAAAPSLEVLSAAYIPDPAPPGASQAVEGRDSQRENDQPVVAGLQRFYREHGDFGALRVILRNASEHFVRVGDDVLLNGGPIERSHVDFVTSDWDARGVIWHKIEPRLVPPGECSEVYVRFRRRPEGEHALLSIPAENADAVTVTIPYEGATVDVDYVTADEAGTTLYAYVRSLKAKPSGGVAEVALNGIPLADAEVYGGDLPDGIALVTARLPEPLEHMSAHAVTVRTTAGEVVGAQFRVVPWCFPRTSIHVPSAICPEMNMNMGMWHYRSWEECEQYGIITNTPTTRMFGVHERVWYIMGPDEPDAHDDRGGGFDRGLGSHARRLMESGWTSLVRTQAPHVATWIIMNGTTRPLNWSVYGRFTDLSSFDPYPVNFYGADHTYVRESLEYVRQTSTPRRMIACLEAYGSRPPDRRAPLPAEYCQNVVQALGVGSKGLTSWVYAGTALGWEHDEALRAEIARVNAMIAHIEDLLLLGTPVPWAETDAGLAPTGRVGDERWPKERVWAGAVLCGPDALLVAVANHIPAAGPMPPEIAPARDVRVTVQLPDYLREVEAYEVTEDGLRKIECTVEGGRAFMRLEHVESGRVFMLRRG